MTSGLIFVENEPRMRVIDWLGKHLDCDVIIRDYDPDTDEANILVYADGLENRGALVKYHKEHPELEYINHISSKAANFIG